MTDVTNKKQSETKEFTDLCREHNVKPTTRQASKFSKKRGILYLRSRGLTHFGENSLGHVGKVDTRHYI